MYMCATTYEVQRPRRAPPKPPEDKLFDLLHEYGINVNPRVLRLILKAEWLRIAALAHAIHESDSVGC